MRAYPTLFKRLSRPRATVTADRHQQSEARVKSGAMSQVTKEGAAKSKALSQSVWLERGRALHFEGGDPELGIRPMSKNSGEM